MQAIRFPGLAFLGAMCVVVAIGLYSDVEHARAGQIYRSDFLGGDIRRGNLDGTGLSTVVSLSLSRHRSGSPALG